MTCPEVTCPECSTSHDVNECVASLPRFMLALYTGHGSREHGIYDRELDKIAPYGRCLYADTATARHQTWLLLVNRTEISDYAWFDASSRLNGRYNSLDELIEVGPNDELP